MCSLMIVQAWSISGRERTEIGAEQRAEHDGAREPHHLFVDIDGPSA